MKRRVIAELLDAESLGPAEVFASLRDIGHVNRWFGGNATMASMLTDLSERAGNRSLSILEVAAGSGDGAEIVRRELQSIGIILRLTLLDRIATHLGGAGCGRASGKRAIVGDALSLPFASSSFDVIHCSLFAHHLAPEQLVHFVNEALRVCRTAVLINDLVRSPLHLALVYAGLPLFRSRVTRHDGPASVRQAYTEKEMDSMLHQSSASQVDIKRFYLFRMGAIAWK